MWSLVDEGLRRAFRAHPVAARIPALEDEVQACARPRARGSRPAGRVPLRVERRAAAVAPS
jgi:hypothetical protein